MVPRDRKEPQNCVPLNFRVKSVSNISDDKTDAQETAELLTVMV